MSNQSIFDIQADLCRCMSSTVRIKIVHTLRDGPQRVSEIARITGHQQAVISRHLGVLRHGGVVTSERHGQDIIYRIANPKIVSICDLMREVLADEASRRSNIVQGLSEE